MGKKRQKLWEKAAEAGFYFGQRVKYKGRPGTIVKIDDDGWFGVCFDYCKDGHNLDNGGGKTTVRDGFGLWIEGKELKKLN